MSAAWVSDALLESSGCKPERPRHRPPQDPTRHRITSSRLLKDANKLALFAGFEKTLFYDALLSFAANVSSYAEARYLLEQLGYGGFSPGTIAQTRIGVSLANRSFHLLSSIVRFSAFAGVRSAHCTV